MVLIKDTPLDHRAGHHTVRNDIGDIGVSSANTGMVEYSMTQEVISC